MRPRAILIERNPHLREQLAETMRRLGIALAGSWEAPPAGCQADLAALAPEIVIFPLMLAHAGQWRLVRELLALPSPPMLIAMAPVDAPAIRQSALAHGVDFVFDPLLELDAFLGALRQLAAATRQLVS